MNSLPHGYQPLPKIRRSCVHWIAKFYNPKHSGGSRDRLNRLEEQARVVIRITLSLKHRLKYVASHQCFRRDIVAQKLQELVDMILKDYKTAYDSNDTDDTDDTDETDKDHDDVRIARIFMNKRYLLNLILFILDNEPDLARTYKTSILQLEDLAIDDTNDWMEILDYVQTLKNPFYLNEI